MKENSLLWYQVNSRVSQTMLNHSQILFLIASSSFCSFGEFAKVFEYLICIVEGLRFQIRVFNCQQILTKIAFVFSCAEMLQQFSPTPKAKATNVTS